MGNSEVRQSDLNASDDSRYHRLIHGNRTSKLLVPTFADLPKRPPLTDDNITATQRIIAAHADDASEALILMQMLGVCPGSIEVSRDEDELDDLDETEAKVS